MSDMDSDVIARTVATYNRIVTRYSECWLDDDVMHESLRKFIDFLPQDPVVVDIGCGIGRDVKFLTNQGIHTIGIDLSLGMLKKAKAVFPQGRFLLMDMRDLGFPTRTFDGIWACASVFHIPKHLIKMVLQELYRVLKKGGVLFLGMQESEDGSWFEPEGRFFAYYDKEDLHIMLKQHNFRVLHFESNVSTKTTFNKPMPVTWMRFWARKE